MPAESRRFACQRGWILLKTPSLVLGRISLGGGGDTLFEARLPLVP